MPDKKYEPLKITMANTKKEMLTAYAQVLKQLKEAEQAELRPEKVREEKAQIEALAVAETETGDDVGGKITKLKTDIGKMLTDLSDKLENETTNYQKIKKAVDLKQAELKEIFEIEKAASSLASLIEAHNIKKAEFEAQMARSRAELEQEIEATRTDWKKEKQEQENLQKESLAKITKERKQEKEEYTYQFEREKQLALDVFQDEMAKKEKDLADKIEATERDLADKVQDIEQREKRIENLEVQVASFPRELEEALANATKQLEKELKKEAAHNEGLQKSVFDGEKNVLNATIQALEKTVEDQSAQITHLSKQLELAYQKVQEIAEKAIEGSSSAKSLNELQHILSSQSRKTESASD
jgi:uncharacterized coiled-coil protein SlyX